MPPLALPRPGDHPGEGGIVKQAHLTEPCHDPVREISLDTPCLESVFEPSRAAGRVRKKPKCDLPRPILGVPVIGREFPTGSGRHP